MMLARSVRTLAFAGLAFGLLTGAGVRLAGADELPPGAEPTPPPLRMSAAPASTSRSVKLGLNKSIVVDLPRDARDVLVSNPVIADAVIRTPRRIYLTGIAVGQTNLIVFDRAGQQIVSLELAVERDGRTLEQMLRRLIPGSDISVEMVTDNIVLSGSVRNSADASRAQDIANIFANGGAQAPQATAGGAAGSSSGTTIAFNTAQPPTSSIINLLTVEGEDQVQLKVTVAEVNRNAVKQLGVDWSAANLNLGGIVFSGALTNGFPVNGSSLGGAMGISNSEDTLSATVQALERTGLFRTLAEPTLTAISGESASFLAGGEFPVPTGFDTSTRQVSITFKQFGVALSFTPVVLSEGRISLHVKTEVSELSNEGAVSLGDISIPSLKVRRAETTMELPSGGAMVMGGLLQDDVRQAISGLPGLKNLPVLGTLFRSRDFLRNETELVILATPYLVKPVARTALATPDQGFSPASDRAGNLLGQINRVYGAQGQAAPAGTYQGHYGYIFE